jgi:hypothetical protein
MELQADEPQGLLRDDVLSRWASAVDIAIQLCQLFYIRESRSPPVFLNLNTLYNRNAGSNVIQSERANVIDYVNRCKSIAGYEYLSKTLAGLASPVDVTAGDGSGPFVDLLCFR